MPSSKGEPTDPELREKIKEEVKAEEKGILPCARLPLDLNDFSGPFIRSERVTYKFVLA